MSLSVSHWMDIWELENFKISITAISKSNIKTSQWSNNMCLFDRTSAFRAIDSLASTIVTIVMWSSVIVYRMSQSSL